MANDKILLSPSAPLPEERNVVTQPQNVPKPRHRPMKFKQIQDSSVSEKQFHSGNMISFGQSDPQGLFGSSGVGLLDKDTAMSRPAPNMLLLSDQPITTNKEASAVIIKQEPFVAPLIPEYTFRNEKKKLLEDAFAPSFSLMKLAYQQGMLSSPRLRDQENAKILEALDKERSMYRPGQNVVQSLEHQIAKNKECLVPPKILEESLRKGKQKLIEESLPPTFPQMNVASQLPSVSLMNGPCPSRASQINLMLLLQKQMQLSRTYEKLPAVVPDVRSIYTPEMCAQRLKLYMYRKQQRPRDNNLEFWVNLVAEFFAPNGKERVCFSSNECRELIGCIFPKDKWCCGICNVRPTAGFETSAEVLPRLWKNKYDTGMLDELLYMDKPEERYTLCGHIVLNYPKVTEHTVYETGRVVREGRLRIVFSSDLKIRVWELCCSAHEIYVGRKSVAPQVHQLKEATQKYQVFAESSSRISPEEFQRTTNELAPTVRELARTLDKSLINDLGYPKRHVRCLQISEIVSSMKDLMDYSKKYRVGPREAMDRIHRESAAVRVAQNSVAERMAQQHIDDVISQHSSVISFAPYPSTDEDGTVGKGYYMDQLENLNRASLFHGIHIGSPSTGTSMGNDTHSNNQQINDQLPYLNGKMDPIDDIQFE